MTFKLIRRDYCLYCGVSKQQNEKLEKVYLIAKNLWREDEGAMYPNVGLYYLTKLKAAIGEIDPKYKDDEE